MYIYLFGKELRFLVLSRIKINTYKFKFHFLLQKANQNPLWASSLYRSIHFNHHLRHLSAKRLTKINKYKGLAYERRFLVFNFVSLIKDLATLYSAVQMIEVAPKSPYPPSNQSKGLVYYYFVYAIIIIIISTVFTNKLLPYYMVINN